MTSSLSRGTLTEGELSSSALVTSSLELISQSAWSVGSQGGDPLGQQTVDQEPQRTWQLQGLAGHISTVENKGAASQIV